MKRKIKRLSLEWVATGDPNVIAANGYPVQIERIPLEGKFHVSGYGRSLVFYTLGSAQREAADLVQEQLAFNAIAGVENEYDPEG